MSFNLQRILESKRALRQQLAAKPVAEKLRLLDELRERALGLSGASRRLTSPSARSRVEPFPFNGTPKS